MCGVIPAAIGFATRGLGFGKHGCFHSTRMFSCDILLFAPWASMYFVLTCVIFRLDCQVNISETVLNAAIAKLAARPGLEQIKMLMNGICSDMKRKNKI